MLLIFYMLRYFIVLLFVGNAFGMNFYSEIVPVDHKSDAAAQAKPLQQKRKTRDEKNEKIGLRKKRQREGFEQVDAVSKTNVEETQLAIANVSAEQVYIPFEPEFIEEYLKQLDGLEGSKSSNFSGLIIDDEATKATFARLDGTEIAGFIPLFERLILEVRNKLLSEQKLFHFAVRIDPNMRNIRKDLQRAASSEWHVHEKDNYLFALTRQDTAATLIKIGDDEFHMKTNQLFLLRANTWHKTPRPQKGKRIHLTIGVLHDDTIGE